MARPVATSAPSEAVANIELSKSRVTPVATLVLASCDDDVMVKEADTCKRRRFYVGIASNVRDPTAEKSISRDFAVSN